jgi:hypothetical protein
MRGRMRKVVLKFRALASAMALATLLCACISHTRQESAALPQPWPQPPPLLTAYGPPAPDYPSTGGDILKGSSPADLAKARAAAFHPLDVPDASGQAESRSEVQAQKPSPQH